ARGEHHDAALFEVADRAAADEVLAYLVDLERAHYPRLRADLLQRVLHCKRVDHGREHAHVIAGHAVHAGCGEALAAKDVAAADHHADLHAGALYLECFACKAIKHLRVDAVVSLAHQGLARELQQDAFVLDRLGHGALFLAAGKTAVL